MNPKFSVGEKVQTTFTNRDGIVTAILERPPEFKERYSYKIKFHFMFLPYSEYHFESMLNKFIA